MSAYRYESIDRHGGEDRKTKETMMEYAIISYMQYRFFRRADFGSAV